MITITVDDLKSHNACQQGIDDFVAFAKGDRLEIDWTPEMQIEIIKSPLRKWFGWAVHSGLIPLWSMADANLSGADLSGADLRYANLIGANLVGANLIGANLVDAELTGANLVGANLMGTDLTGANLTGANLIFADLVGAIMPEGYQK